MVDGETENHQLVNVFLSASIIFKSENLQASGSDYEVVRLKVSCRIRKERKSQELLLILILSKGWSRVRWCIICSMQMLI